MLSHTPLIFIYPRRVIPGCGEIIGDALDLQDDTMDMINHRPEGEKADKYYKGITKEFFAGIDALYERLSDLSKK